MSLAEQGNYIEIRTVLFKFRELAHKKRINWKKLKHDQVDHINRIKVKSFWTYTEAFITLEILRLFGRELKPYKIDVEYLPVPKVKNATAGVKKPKSKRIEMLSYDDGNLVLHINFSNEKISQLRAVKNKKYNAEKKEWTFPLSEMEPVLSFCKKMHIPIGQQATNIINDLSNNLQQSYSAKRVELNIPLNEGYDFLDYQTVGIDFCIRVKRSWITDEMGLGKTLQAIGTALGLGMFPVLILCPKSVRHNWKMEIEKFTNKKAHILTDKTGENIEGLVESGSMDFLIANYDGLKKHFCEKFEKKEDKNGIKKTYITLNGRQKQFKGGIIDESHEVKNPKADRYKIIKKMIDHMEYKQLLTGTPFVNRPDDISAQLDLIGRLKDLGGIDDFKKKYRGMTQNGFNKGVKKKKKSEQEDNNLAELNTELRTMCMIRREKHQVLTDMPDKFRKEVHLELTNRKEYDHAYINLRDWLINTGASDAKVQSASRAEMLVRMNTLKKLSSEGRIKDAAEYVKSIIDQGEKVVLFVWFKDTIDMFRRHFPDLVEITGNVTDDDVAMNKQKFMEDDDCKLMVVSYKRGGVGHTLTSSSNVVFMELGWNPKDQDQAEDRCHRLTQKNHVTCHYLMGKDTIDTYIYNIINKKRKQSNESLGATVEIETSIENDLIKAISNNKYEG